MSNNKAFKGVSPLVAVITLIAFTLIIAGFLANWATQFTERRIVEAERCLDAEAIIQGAVYDSSANELMLYVNNRGSVDLTFDVILTYDDGSVEKPSGTYAVDAGDLGTFTLTSVSSSLKEASIQGKECRSAQDFVGKSWINGL